MLNSALTGKPNLVILLLDFTGSGNIYLLTTELYSANRINELITTVTDNANSRVLKAGDTMTGQLNINNSLTTGEGQGLNIVNLNTQTDGSLVNITGTQFRDALKITTGNINMNNNDIIDVAKIEYVSNDNMQIVNASLGGI